MGKHELHRFSDWTVYCSKCNREFQDPVPSGRARPFSTEANLPKLKDNPNCLADEVSEEAKSK